ncbi:hypothetical protein E2C01_035313 [Portunus trituberculatus]|uniref:Uncharacterized protein n=1 Tax=Portunus trituberculatus TaxID=210409 RepID=A0A5B7F9F4_PORTR|nr:hypothetical protein [Portunus trituberculatus]
MTRATLGPARGRESDARPRDRLGRGQKQSGQDSSSIGRGGRRMGGKCEWGGKVNTRLSRCSAGTDQEVVLAERRTLVRRRATRRPLDTQTSVPLHTNYPPMNLLIEAPTEAAHLAYSYTSEERINTLREGGEGGTRCSKT